MKVISIIQARMGSSRLPGKSMEIINKKPMIYHVIKQISFSTMINEIILATTDKPQDDVLSDYVSGLGIKVHRGNEQNVLSRYYNAALEANADIFVRNTGDNPLVDPTIIDNFINVMIDGDYEYVSNNIDRSYPRGYDVEVVNFESFEKIYQKATKSEYLEHVTIYYKEYLEEFKYRSMISKNKYKYPNIRLTVDTVEDLELIKKIYNEFGQKNKYISIDQVIDFIMRKPELLDINKNIKQTLVFDKSF